MIGIGEAFGGIKEKLGTCGACVWGRGPHAIRCVKLTKALLSTSEPSWKDLGKHGDVARAELERISRKLA